MPFIGQQPTTGAFIQLDSLTASATANYTLQLNGANYEPESVNNLLVSINGVIQGSSTMSLSGSTLTVGATLSSSDVIDFVRVFGNVGTISTPTDGSVTVNKLGTGAVTNAKIADSTIDLTSKVTGVLPSANSQTNTPAFEAQLSSNQSISDNTSTKVNFATEIFDTDNKYDSSTNYRFTPTVAGKYFVYLSLGIGAGAASQLQNIYAILRKNGNIVKHSHFNFDANNVRFGTVNINAIITFDSDDYIEAFAQAADSSGSAIIEASNYSTFGAYKLIGA